MANMSYCRFQNTVGDFEDCVRSFDEKSFKKLTPEEQKAARTLYELALEFVAEFEAQTGEEH